MSFPLSETVNPSKTFIVRKTDVAGRLDAFFFRPELVALEKSIQEITSHKLRDFVKHMAGGATPPTTNKEEHYTEKADGVPFIRVQNLSTSGELNIGENVKKITISTHEGLLGRSRLSGGELLVKITGVGRMAVASVVPDNFQGNINQHIVAIRTKDKETSELLATFLNLDIIEKLASRRATGGTRPALDYPALLSIPIVLDKRIPKLMQMAIALFQQKTSEASKLLDRIDDLLLDELDIQRKPEPANAIGGRIFRLSFADATGKRFDPIANQGKCRRFEQSIHSSRYPVLPLRKLIGVSKTLVDSIDDGENYVGLENIEGESGEFISTTEKESVGTAIRFEVGQILFPKLRPYLNKTHIATFDGICSTEFHVFTPKGASGDYLTNFFRSRVIVGITSLLMTGNTLPRLQLNDIESLPTPVPPVEIQENICSKINDLRAKARNLREQARADLEGAKRDIEALILEKTSNR